MKLAKVAEPTPQKLEALTKCFIAGKFAQAESISRSLIKLFPTNGIVWKILGATQSALGRNKESLVAKKKAVELLPDDHDARFNFAYGLHQEGLYDEAIKEYFQALAIQPNRAVSYANLGDVLKKVGFLIDSEAYCRQAIELMPDLDVAHNNLGNALQAQGKFLEAELSYRKALALRPNWAEAYNNLAITLHDQGFASEAEVCYRNALALKPDWAAAHSNLLQCMSLNVQVEPEQLCAEHLAFGERFESPLRASWQAHHNTKQPERCLEIGFVSGDLYDHAIASFLEPVLEFLAKKQTLSLHAYYTNTIEDAVNQRLHTYFPNWHAIAGMSDADLAEKIRTDDIDILIDLSSHTAHNRLLTFARKPAPIQVTWMGYPGTTGLQAMDYHLSEKVYIPPSLLDWQFTEKLVFLPASAIFLPSKHAPPVNPLPALAKGYITFGSFNRPNKLNTAVIALWSMLLRCIPTARLVLGAMPPDSQNALTQHFVNEGIKESRLTFFPKSNLMAYLEMHHQVDICLDTFPYAGGTTTCHAAWMGAPTLTLNGETAASRSGVCIMSHWGLKQFIASSIEDFVQKGSYWTEHLDELAALRLTMRDRFYSSPIGKAEPFANWVEAALRAMWQRWCDDLPPAPIEITQAVN